MDEYLQIRQDFEFRTVFYKQIPGNHANHGRLVMVNRFQQLTPFQMLLGSLGVCTGILLHSYAQERQIDLKMLIFRLTYSHEKIQTGNDVLDLIEQTISYSGSLSEEENDRLEAVSRHCAVHHILQKGIQIETRWNKRQIMGEKEKQLEI